MASNYTVSGRGDLDAIFKARTSAAGAASGFQVAGVDLNQRYEPRGSSTAVAATGYQVAGVDLAQQFMDINNLAAGAYLSAKTVQEIAAYGFATYGVDHSGRLRYSQGPGGTTQLGEQWCVPVGNVGLYEVRATKLTGTTEFIGSFGTWYDCASAGLNNSRYWYVQSAGLSQGTMTVEIRRKSDLVVEATATITLRCV